MKVELQGTIVNITAKINASSDVVKRVVLEVHGDMAELQRLMRLPLSVTLASLDPVSGLEAPDA